MIKSLIFTATYNEKNNIRVFIEKINQLNIDADILVIDDNSPDNTKLVLDDLKNTYSNLKVIIRENKQGLDTAHKLGFNYAQSNNYINFITLDADLSHDPNEIPKIINLLKNNEFVIGSRYIKGGNCEMSFFRKILSKFGNKIIKYILNMKCNEFTTSYRGFNLEKLKNFELNEINSKGYSFFMETIFRLYKKNYSIYEIPIDFKNRTQGKSKISKIEIFRTLKNLFILKFFNN